MNAPALDIASMTKVQKLSALLIILGPETAGEILKTLDPTELESISAEMARLPVITPELRDAILREMSEVAATASTTQPSSRLVAQQALEKAVGPAKASDIIERVSPSQNGSAAMRRLAELESRLLFNLIRAESPQAIAFILSHLPSAKCSELLVLLPAETRDSAIERLATLGPTPVEIVEIVAEALQRRLVGKSPSAKWPSPTTLKHSGGVKTAADALNALSKNLSKSMLASLEERNPELGQAIRQKMFAFIDLVRLDNAALQKVLREVETRDLALALKKADEVLKTKLFGAISKRAAETVKDEINMMPAVKLKEISAAQNRIIEVVRRLEETGEIELDAEKEALADGQL